MFRKNLKIRTLRFKTERIYTGIRVRRAATIHIRNKVNGYGAEKYPIERVCSGILEILTCGIADFIILKVVYPTSNGKIKQKTGFSSPQILNGYAPEYVPKVSAYENYQRLSLIMRENLDPYFDGVTAGYGATTRASSINGVIAEEIKCGWYEHNKVDDLSTLGSQILRSYRRFASSLFPDVLGRKHQIALDNRILTELTTRTDLDPYDCEAFRLALEFNKKMV